MHGCVFCIVAQDCSKRNTCRHCRRQDNCHDAGGREAVDHMSSCDDLWLNEGTKADMQHLTNQLNQATALCAQSEEKRAIAEATVLTLHAVYEEHAAAGQHCQIQLLDTRAQLQLTQDQLQHTKGELHQARAELEAAQVRITQLESELQHHNSRSSQTLQASAIRQVKLPKCFVLASTYAHSNHCTIWNMRNQILSSSVQAKRFCHASTACV